mgnify:CR=1 FL=1|tara:strand:+ start:130 stop:993 length:864 start_codon:yes stop_codon:yes gene_type:complete
MKYLSYIFLFFYLCYSPISFAIDLKMYEGDEYWNKIDALNWIDGPNNIKHTNQGKVIIQEGYSALINDDAEQIMFWINGQQFNVQLFVQEDFGPYISYFYVNEGYVSLDDWKDVNPDKFIKEIDKGRIEGNKIRLKNNSSTVNSIGWIKEPTLDRKNNAVYYALIVNFSDNTSSVNAITLLLGRYGHTKATYVGEVDYFKDNNEAIFKKIVNNYSFIEQKKYTNFSTGDKVAAAGIGGLLAASLGVKAFKAGGIAALLILLKKGGFLLFLPLIFAWGWIKRLFTRKE